MATKKKIRYSLVMEYNEEEDQLEFIEERLEPIGELLELVRVEKLTKEEFITYLESREDIAIA
jgi:hypothetical protein